MSDPSSGAGTSQSKPPPKYPKKKYEKKEADLSEEDLDLKKQLELYVERIQDPNPELQRAALESMRQEILTSTSSMAYVVKPLKFLRPHYGILKDFFETLPDSDFKKRLADVLSVLALTMSAEGERASLKYKLLDSEGNIGSWGHKYVRNLAGEITQEYKERSEDINFPIDDILNLVEQIVAIHMKHNAEPEAVDILMEVDELHNSVLTGNVDSTNFWRTCLYLISAARFLPQEDRRLALGIACTIYLEVEEFANALQIALFLDDEEVLPRVEEVFTSCEDLLKKKQLCYIFAQHGIYFKLVEDMCWDTDDRKVLQDIINNTKLSKSYLTLAWNFKVMEPISPDYIYKAHLLDGHAGAGAGAGVYSAAQYLAATFINAFVNAGFLRDKLMTVPPDSSGFWVFKNKEHAKISAAASLGMILLWDVDFGLPQMCNYICCNDNYVIAGALLGVGLVNCNVDKNFYRAFPILRNYLGNEDSAIRIGAIMGLGIAYTGAQKNKIRRLLTAILKDGKETPLDVIAFTAISLGLVCVGSYNETAAQAIVDALMVRSESEMEEPLTRLLALGYGLLYLGQERLGLGLENTPEASKTVNVKIRKYWDLTLLSCAYAGTGDVEIVRKLLGHCSEHLETGDIHQGPAVLGIAMVATAEELGLEMSIRSLEHLLQYGKPNIRRAVPLALGLLCTSNPKVKVINILSELSHDTDSEVAMAAVISLGLIGAGTNNACIVGMLRKLSRYYHEDDSLLFCVRIAQGLVHLGKGLLTLDPYHCNRFLLSPTAFAGLITLLHACLDMKTIILGKYHFVLYFLVLAMRPKMLMTVDENLQPLSVPVRVGQAVGVESMAGQPTTITNFRTMMTPALLGAGQRAELATGRYVPLSPTLEGHVILKEKSRAQRR
ncbi:hypothetical protein V6N13_035551 [Hibiscus sabdariffa]|uniref:26S proteasome non-ATPase regulatory subunit 2 homolog n=1 Tax=Hibiscus sabdariffa TaxID=183260 RepID=A0ABR2S919_9ROSI